MTQSSTNNVYMPFTPKGEASFNTVGLFTYLRTYARRKDDSDPNSLIESWEECLTRVVLATNNQLNVGFTNEEQQELFDLLYNLKCSVAGRFLWQLGTRTVDTNGLLSLQNCFQQDTKFWTSEGLKSFKDFNNGDKVVIRGKNKWMDATVLSFGEQQLYELTLGTKGAHRKIYTTANHRWLAKTKVGDGVFNFKEKLTTELRSGWTLQTFAKRTNFNRIEMCAVGIQHGIVFGDGHKLSNVDCCGITLCGDKKQDLSPYFFSVRKDNNMITGLPCTWKDLPSLTMNKEYLYGFLAGLFATDGSISNSSCMSMSSANISVLEWIKNAFMKLDVLTGPIKLLRETNPFNGEYNPCYSILIYRYHLPQEFFIRESQRSRFKSVSGNQNWKVIDVKPTNRVETVWCVSEPIYEEFTLEDGILTKNCSSVVIDEPVEPFKWAMNFLMLGAGVGFRVLPEDVAKLPIVKNALITRKDTHDADHIVPDSREGWIGLLGKVLKAHFYSGKSFSYSCVLLRSKGAPIKGFGGLASGPEVLCEGMSKISDILNKRVGKQIRPIDALDIMNIIGMIVVSGNVRRSALLALGDCKDEEYLRAKRWDLGNVPNYRAYSNNSVICNDIEDVLNNDEFWQGYEGNGEPYGLINLDLMRSCGRLGETQYPDPNVACVNPCCFHEDTLIAVADGRNAVTIKQLADEDKDVPVYSMNPVTGEIEIKWGRAPRVSGHNQKLLRIVLDNDSFIDVTPFHKFYTMDGREVRADELIQGDSLPKFYKASYKSRDEQSYYNVRTQAFWNDRTQTNYGTGEHILIGKFFHAEEWDMAQQLYVESNMENRLKPIVHHKDHNKTNNSPENLEIISWGEHSAEHASDRVFSEEGRKNLSEKMKKQKKEWDVKNADSFEIESGLRTIRISDTQVDVILTCEGCKEEFQVPKRKRGISYCSTRCSNICKNAIASSLKSNRIVRDSNAYKNFQKQIEVYESLGKDVQKKQWELECKERGVSFRFQTSTPNKWIAKNWVDFKARVVNEKFKKEQWHKQIMTYKDLQQNGDVTQEEWEIECGNRGIVYSFILDTDDNYCARNWEDFQQLADDYNHRVKSIIELDGEHTVYNMTIEDNHTMSIITHIEKDENGNIVKYTGVQAKNSEQNLESGESCCLAELYLPNISTRDELFLCAKYLYRICKHSLTLPCADSKKTEEIVHRNMRMGLGVTGYLQATEEQRSWLSSCYEMLREFDNEYSNSKGFPRSIKLCTVKPSGTLSLLAGVTSGVHPGFARYYIRRVRIASESPLVTLAKKNGYPVEFVRNFDGTNNHDTMVISFPYSLPEGTILAKECTAVQQLEFAKRLQTEWSDNSISITCYYRRGELDSIKEWLRINYNHSVKSVSFLLHSDHGFDQAPLEEITKEVHDEMVRVSKPIKSTEGICYVEKDEEYIGESECVGGSCPVK